jgi:hypothetical protein
MRKRTNDSPARHPISRARRSDCGATSSSCALRANGASRDVMRAATQHEEAERVGEAAPVVGRREQRDRSLVLRRGGAPSGDVMRHREQITVSRRPLVAEPLEQRKRLLVMRAGARLEVDAPFPTRFRLRATSASSPIARATVSASRR